MQLLEQGFLLGGSLFDEQKGLRSSLAEQIRERTTTAVLMSHEGFLRNTRYGAGFEQPGHDIALTASRLFSYFSPLADQFDTSVQIIVTLRSQFSLLPSYHSYFVPEYPWSRYLDECVIAEKKGFARALDFNHVLNVYSQLFGSHNLHIFLYEDYVSNTQLFLSRFATLLDVGDQSFIEKAGQSRLNTSEMSVRGWMRKRRWVRHAQRYRAGTRFLQIAEAVVPKGLWSALATELTPYPTEEERAAINQVYGAGNASVSDLYGLDLSLLDYPYIANSDNR